MSSLAAQGSRGYFVAGTDTGVGKTLVACALLHTRRAQGLKAIGMKPVAAGCERTAEGWVNQDVEVLRAAGSVALPREAINVYAFQEPIAPHIAEPARAEPVAAVPGAAVAVPEPAVPAATGVVGVAVPERE